MAKVNKLKAYCKVGKQFDLPLDNLKGVANVDRTLSTINASLKAIDFDSDKLIASLFWFINKTVTDQIAIKHLETGNFDKAFEIWSKVNTVSSLHNRALCNIILGEYDSYVGAVNALYSDRGHEYCELLEASCSPQELLKLYLEAIEHDNPKILDAIYQESPKGVILSEIKLDKGDFEIFDVYLEDCTRRIKFISDRKEHIINIDKAIDDIPDTVILNNLDNFVIEYKPNGGVWLRHKNKILGLSKLWVDTLYSLLGNRYVKRIEEAINTVSKFDKNNYTERRKGAVILIGELNLCPLNRVLDVGMEKAIRGKAVKEALQCVIDYYNNAPNQDNVVEEACRLTFQLLRKAQGTVYYERVKENHITLKKHEAKLPPKSVRYYDSLLTARIEAYENEPSTIGHALKFIRDCVPYLMSIKAIIGETHNYYVNVSTRIAAMVLDDVIDDYNKQSDDILPSIKNVSYWEKQKLLDQFKSLVTVAATAMYQLTFFNMEDSFRKQRFQKNYDIIKKQTIDCGAITPVTSDRTVVVEINGKFKSCSKFEDFLPEIDTRDEEAYFNTCKTVEDCNTYIRIFPNGKHASGIQAKIEECTFNECDTQEQLDAFIQKYPNTKMSVKSKREMIIFKSCKTVNDYRMYLSKYPSGCYVKQVKEKIEDLFFSNCNGRLDYIKYLADYPEGRHTLEAQRIIDDIDYKECKTISDYKQYLQNHPHGCHVKEVVNRIDDLTFESCSTEQDYLSYLATYPSGVHVSEAQRKLEDYRFWHNCEKAKSRKLYKEYVAKYPNGIFRKEADKRLKSWWRDALLKVVSNKSLSITIAVVAVVLIAIGIIWGADGYKGLMLGLGWISGMGLISSFFALFQKEWKPFVGFLIATAVFFGGAIGWDELERYNARQQKARAALDEALNSGNIYRLYSFLHDYSDTKWANEAYTLLYYKCTASGWKETIEFAGTFSDTEWGTSAYSVATQKCDSIFNASGLNHMSESDEYRASLDSLRNGSYRPLISLIENLEWENEDTAWAMAVKNNTIDFYNKFIEKFPSSGHVSQAEKRIIDLEVNNVFNSSYDELPSMNRASHSNSATSSISIYNNTSYTLTVMYSGKDSKKVVISPHGRVYVTLPNGIYKCVASISGNARNHAGTETLDGGSYEVEYYIVTSTYPSYRHF